MQMRVVPNGGSGGGGGGDNGKDYNEAKRRRPQKKKKKLMNKVSAVQRLYDVCKDVFADCGPGVVPSPQKVETLAAILDGMTQLDVGLRPDMPFFSSKQAPTISYLHLHECDKFSIGIFCLPPKSVIPLHNHPGMTVFGKLLFGTMHIKAYDWCNEVDKDINLATSQNANDPKRRLAKVKVDSEFTAPCRTSILYPNDGGNMHCFTAKTACAVLDVLGPPYCDPEGRHCQYYSEIPFSKLPVEGLSIGKGERDGFAWLEEREKPDELSVVGVPYNGPKIVKS